MTLTQDVDRHNLLDIIETGKFDNPLSREIQHMDRAIDHMERARNWLIVAVIAQGCNVIALIVAFIGKWVIRWK